MIVGRWIQTSEWLDVGSRRLDGWTLDPDVWMVGSRCLKRLMTNERRKGEEGWRTGEERGTLITTDLPSACSISNGKDIANK